MPSYDARMIPDKSVGNGHIREHCSAHRSQIGTIGRGKGQQVRIERPTPSGDTLALYTVIDVHDGEPEDVFIGYKDQDDLLKRLGLSGIDRFAGRINAQVPDPDLTDEGAEKGNEFFERLKDNGRHRGLIVIAPHGGEIERHTDEQAEHVRDLLSAKCVSVWMCKGFKEGPGAFDRWHITSTDISPESFPKLKTLIGRRFEYAVAFHGWDEDSICIGGSARPDLKKEIKAKIVGAIADPSIVVNTDEDGCPAGFNGNDSRNIVNRLATNGIQIEQSKDARRKHHDKIAEAVADVMRPKIEVCTAPVFEASDPWTCLMRSLGDGVRGISRGGVASIPCEIRRLRFRIRNCRRGNSDPCIEL